MNSSGYVGTGVREGVGGTLGAGEEGNESGKLSGGVYICGSGGELGGGVVAVEGGFASTSSSSSECTRCTKTFSSTREYSANIIWPKGSCDSCDICKTSYADFELDDADAAAAPSGTAASGFTGGVVVCSGLDNNLRLRRFGKLFLEEEDGAFKGERGFGKKTLW